MIHPDFAALQAAQKPISLGLRIGVFAGQPASDKTAANLAQLARLLVQTATTAGLQIDALELDFDARTDQLGGYRAWLQTISRAIAPVPLRFTALPDWLSSKDFEALARSASLYTLQVHYLQRPKAPDQLLPLCDPVQARRWIKKAARFGLPFQVALPTYGYELAFAPSGRYLGGRAEPGARWPKGARLHRLMADPAALAELVRALKAKRPKALKRLIWYRLPTERDRLNWRWPTFEAVRSGAKLEVKLVPMLERRGPELYDLILRNQGTLDAKTIPALHVQGAQTADALAGFKLSRTERWLRFEPTQPRALSAGARVLVGWVRAASPPRIELSAPL